MQRRTLLRRPGTNLTLAVYSQERFTGPQGRGRALLFHRRVAADTARDRSPATYCQQRAARRQGQDNMSSVSLRGHGGSVCYEQVAAGLFLASVSQTGKKRSTCRCTLTILCSEAHNKRPASVYSQHFATGRQEGRDVPLINLELAWGRRTNQPCAAYSQ